MANRDSVRAEDIFEQALYFHYSALILSRALSARPPRSSPDEAIRHPSLKPAIVNSALAVELYFKCIWCFENATDPPLDHNLRNLFAKLSPDIRTRIEHVWMSHSGHIFDTANATLALQLNPPRRFVTVFTPEGHLHFVDRKTNRGRQPTLPEYLADAAQAFEKWRYSYEGSVTNYDCGHLEFAALMAILERKPEWQPLADSCEPLPTFQVP